MGFLGVPVGIRGFQEYSMETQRVSKVFQERSSRFQEHFKGVP